MSARSRTGRISFYKKDMIPIAIFVFLLVVLIISTHFTGRIPVIESLSKHSCRPGDLISIYGNYFSEEQGSGMVLISGKPITSRFQEWGAEKISFIVPEKMDSGLISVHTDKGESKELILILNQEYIPDIVAGPARPGVPHITDLSPGKGPSGAVITLTGFNFGQDQANSNVYFTWISGDQEDQEHEEQNTLLSSLVPAQEYDFDFISWSDREIRLRIPDGTFPGPLLVATDKGISSPLYLEVEEPIGKKSYEEKRIYQLSYTVQVNNINAEQDNGLYLWLPRLTSAPEQREIKVIFSDPLPRLENYRGSMQFYFAELLPGGKYQVHVSFMFKRYAVSTRITNPLKITNKYEVSGEYLAPFFQADKYVPSNQAGVKKTSGKVVASITNPVQRDNPYYIARALYDYLTDFLVFKVSPHVFRQDLSALLSKAKMEANALDYSLLYCALLRSQAIPARLVGGYLINNEKLNTPHFWVEFYIEKFGWFPVDPVLGSGASPLALVVQSNPREFYFGNLDNQHITFSKGIIELNQMSPRGKVIASLKSTALQTIYEESVGKLHSYSSLWSGLEDIGIY